MPSFKSKVLKIVKKIPKGRVMTYKEIARRAGRLRAYRAVGNILSRNYDSKIPCHRVIRSDGKVGGYNRGRKAKLALLKKELLKKDCLKNKNKASPLSPINWT